MNLREIDRLIMIHVMGNVWPEDRCRICGWTLKESVVEGCTKGSCSLRPAPERRADEPAFYSSDALSARCVREKLAETWDWMLGRGKTRPDEKPFGFGLMEKKLSPRTDLDFVHLVEAETEELAICACALNSVGVEIPD